MVIKGKAKIIKSDFLIGYQNLLLRFIGGYNNNIITCM